jgi:hypothetical protein
VYRRPIKVSTSRRVGSVLATASLLGVLASCGEETAVTPLPAASATAIGEVESTPSPVPASVPWSDRKDFETWNPTPPPGQDGWPTEPPSRWPHLRVRLVLPDTVQPGESVDYAVLIRNQSTAVVDLRPCGGYRQEVQVVGAGMAAEPVKAGESRFRLNCDERPRLRPGEQRSYAMRLVVPQGVTGDEILFTWGFVDNMPDYDAQRWIGLLTG